MTRRTKAAKEKARLARPPEPTLADPYREAWLALTPAERMRRSWRLRLRLRNPEAVHDAKTLPEF